MPLRAPYTPLVARAPPIVSPALCTLPREAHCVTGAYPAPSSAGAVVPRPVADQRGQAPDVSGLRLDEVGSQPWMVRQQVGDERRRHLVYAGVRAQGPRGGSSRAPAADRRLVEGAARPLHRQHPLRAPDRRDRKLDVATPYHVEGV